MKKTIVIFLVLLLLSLIYGCSQNFTSNSTQSMSSISTEEHILTNTPSPYAVSPSASFTETPFNTTGPVRTINPKYDLGKTIEATQASVISPTKNPAENEFLYQDAVVTFFLIDMEDAIAYINLDDLSDNGINNSDVEINRTTGNVSFYFLYPINNALYYYSPDNQDYDSCLTHLLGMNLSNIDYFSQSSHFIYGGYYCVLTNEGRIAVLSYIPDSKKIVEIPSEGMFDTPEELSIKVTVYSKFAY